MWTAAFCTVRVSRIQVAVGFEPDSDLTLVLGPAIKSFATGVRGIIQHVGLPSGDCPPDMPQIIIQGQGGMVNLAMERMDVFLVLPRHVNNDYEACSRLAQSFSIAAAKQLIEGRVKYQWCGMVAQLRFPGKAAKSAIEAVTPAYEKLVQVPLRGRPLAACDIHFGFLESGLFKNYRVSGYATHSLPVPTAGQEQWVDPGGLPVSEAGIQVQVDVNNRPVEQKRGILADLEAVFNASRGAVSKLGDELNLSEVLK